MFFPWSVRLASLPFLCNSLGAHHIFVGQAWAEGKGALATSRHCFFFFFFFFCFIITRVRPI